MGIRRAIARVGDEVFTVVTDEAAVTVRVEGTSDERRFTARYLGHGRLTVEHEGTRHVAWVVEDGDNRWVHCDGEVVVVELSSGVPRDRPARRSRVESESLAAPMPATVVRLAVAPGERVAQGAPIVLLEAMKMELPLRAPFDGIVRAVHCSEGDLVPAGVPLVELAVLPTDP